MIARVRGVIAAATAAGSIVRRPGSTSARTGVPPAWITALIVAGNVIAGAITSSPGPTPSARRARWRPAVHEPTAIACAVPISDANSSSKRSVRAPVPSQPERRTSMTAVSSSGPSDGRANGRKLLRTGAPPSIAGRSGVAAWRRSACGRRGAAVSRLRCEVWMRMVVAVPGRRLCPNRTGARKRRVDCGREPWSPWPRGSRPPANGPPERPRPRARKSGSRSTPPKPIRGDSPRPHMDATKSEEATLCRRRGGRATRLLAGLLAALLLCANAPVARGEDEADEGGGMPPEWGAAIDAYTRDPVANRDRVLAIERDPGGQLPPQVQVIIADAYLRGGQAAAAERILRDALASGPQYPWDIFAKLGLGSARLMQGDATGAQQYFADVAAAPQESSRLFGELGLGHAYLANDQPEEAKAAFDAAATNKAVDSQFRQAGQFGSAASLYAAGDYEGAAKAFDALADSDPKSKIALDARYAAARARLAAGDRDAAKRALEGMESRCASVKTAGRAPRSLRNLDARALRRAWLRNYQQSSWAESMGTDSTMYSIGGCDL